MADEVITKELNRLAYQFETSVKFREFITSFLNEFQELYESDLQLLNNRYLNVAEGVQLDGIGEIVGLPRPSKDLDVAGLFGFLNDTTSLGFSSTSDIAQGGHFWSGTPDQVPIDDESYRLLIRAKIIENQTSMTVDETLDLISFIFGNVTVRYFLLLNLYPVYEIQKTLSSFELTLVSDLPILIGLGDITYVSSPAVIPFGFIGDGTAVGFSDTGDPAQGGYFSQTV